MNWPVIAFAFIVGSAVGGFWFGSDYKEKSMVAAMEKEHDDFMKGALLVGQELAKVKVVQKNTTNILEKEVRIEKQYQECRHSAEALKALNSALVPGATK